MAGRGQTEAGWSQMSNPRLAPQGRLQAGLRRALEMGEAFRCPLTELCHHHGQSRGPGGAWVYSWPWHMLQVKVAMLG